MSKKHYPKVYVGDRVRVGQRDGTVLQVALFRDMLLLAEDVVAAEQLSRTVLSKGVEPMTYCRALIQFDSGALAWHGSTDFSILDSRGDA